MPIATIAPKEASTSGANARLDVRLRSSVEDSAAKMSARWTFPTQTTFRALASEWAENYPALAQKLVANETYNLFPETPNSTMPFPCSEETKLAVFSVLRAAKGESQASAAFKAVTGISALSLWRELDATMPGFGRDIRPKYTFEQKKLYLEAHLLNVR